MIRPYGKWMGSNSITQQYYEGASNTLFGNKIIYYPTKKGYQTDSLFNFI